MEPTSENPVLNPIPEPPAIPQFQTITPEMPEEPQRHIVDLPDPEGSSEESAAKTTGKHRKPGPPDTKTPVTRTRRPTSRTVKESKEDKPLPPPRIKPPDFAEWQDFTGNFALKWLLRGYIGFAFRGIDRETVLNAAELRAIEPDEALLASASKPIAHMASRSSFMTKNGRAIIDSAEGVEALIAVGMWMHTVNRIARKHSDQATIIVKPKKERNHEHGKSVPGEPSGPRVQESQSPASANGTGVRIGGAAPGVGG
jgi:hypothetical protein